MKTRMQVAKAVACAVALAACTSAASAQPAYAYGMGPGMMGGYGYGPGAMMGAEPGMMGGYGPGYGRGYGMGGYGPGAGMMGGYGPGAASLGALNLTDEQKTKIAEVSRELHTKRWALMGRMMDARFKLEELYAADKPDAAAIDRQYKEIDGVRRQMIEQSLEARNQIDGLLTKEQRDQWKAYGRQRQAWMMMPPF